ncbi:LOW QUALITY PROTEIN: hypothetical protein ACHAWU_000027 [Discostella pseudostelligera]|uniref:Peptidase M43 pregnancy-associated plasma-A domain-containing protein n=1 Tax=Discostella pseudostelligera TaxID=259834 RepID=A0ABD3MAS5_9STRA
MKMTTSNNYPWCTDGEPIFTSDFQHQNDGWWCDTPDMTLEEQEKDAEDFQAWMMMKIKASSLQADGRVGAAASMLSRNWSTPGTVITIPTYFHVIHNGTSGKQFEYECFQPNVHSKSNQAADFEEKRVCIDQTQTVVPTIVCLAGTTATDNVSPGDEELAMKMALRRGGKETLNVYVISPAGTRLGWAYHPDGVDVVEDGVVIMNESMPGGTEFPSANEGDTLTHEVGHWLSLRHTFDDGCLGPGDYMEFTPPSADYTNTTTNKKNILDVQWIWMIVPMIQERNLRFTASCLMLMTTAWINSLLDRYPKYSKLGTCTVTSWIQRSNRRRGTISQPTTTSPTGEPSAEPTTSTPTGEPSAEPTTSKSTGEPSSAEPTTSKPTSKPSAEPTTSKPTIHPTKSPTVEPSAEPTTSKPTWEPSTEPTTLKPTRKPSAEPTTSKPTIHPTKLPTVEPSAEPTTSKPTSKPSAEPTTSKPTIHPTRSPTMEPSAEPTTSKPTGEPSVEPNSSKPTRKLSAELMTSKPTIHPTKLPTVELSNQHLPKAKTGKNQ